MEVYGKGQYNYGLEGVKIELNIQKKSKLKILCYNKKLKDVLIFKMLLCIYDFKYIFQFRYLSGFMVMGLIKLFLKFDVYFSICIRDLLREKGWEI